MQHDHLGWLFRYREKLCDTLFQFGRSSISAMNFLFNSNGSENVLQGFSCDVFVKCFISAEPISVVLLTGMSSPGNYSDGTCFLGTCGASQDVSWRFARWRPQPPACKSPFFQARRVAACPHLKSHLLCNLPHLVLCPQHLLIELSNTGLGDSIDEDDFIG